jgi:glycosyltransferase involved in cell wall biosynthesis
MTRPTRLAVVLSHPTQYYSPWFRWISGNTSLELRVFYLWDFGVRQTVDREFGASFKWNVDLLSGYDSEFVKNVSERPGPDHFFGFRNPDLTRRLAEWRPDVLLMFGYKYASHLGALAWARRKGVPVLFRGDSHLIGRDRLRPHVRLMLKALYSQFSGFLYVGAANREYFEVLGVRESRLFFCPHCVDSARFDRANPEYQSGAAALRSKMGIAPSAKVVLFAGKFVPAKQPAELLEAFLGLGIANTALVFVGDGVERAKLERIAGTRPEIQGGPIVRFLPFANQSEMPAHLAMADVFALPSRGVYETWGLVVNEAMHMGIPCLVSDRVGCQRDLVTHGETGWVFSIEEAGSLQSVLGRALADVDSPARVIELREAVLRRIAGYTYSRATEGLLAALATLRA